MGVPADWRLNVFRSLGEGRPVAERIALLERARAESGGAHPDGRKAIEQVLEELRMEQRGELN